MSTLKNSTTIPRDVNTENDLDFEYLRRVGIRYIASIGGGLWTDYNEHDPGITILEMLSYAITDLGMRIDLPMPDLLAGKSGSSAISDQFYTAEQILPGRAVTAMDYRKLFIDIPGVRNCWIVPFKQTIYGDCQNGELSYNRDAFPDTPPQYLTHFDLKGLNSLLVDFDVDDDDPDRATKIASITRAIYKKYHANRNLCEDLAEVKEVEGQPISVCGKIEIADDADEDLVNAQVVFAIYNYFSPFLKFRSLKEMRERGYGMDEIFEGPLLEHGFIDPHELAASGLRSEIRLSDIINLVMDIPGVKNIREISIGNCSEKNGDDWMICIDKFKRPVLCDKSKATYYKDMLPVMVNQARSDEFLSELKAAAMAEDDDASQNMFPELPRGTNMDAGWYTTIQNDFPETYGIGKMGLSSNATVERKAHAKQLKAYLLFFDQVLATYFSYLRNVKDLLAVNTDKRPTFFTQAVTDIEGFAELVSNYPQGDNARLGDMLFAGLANNTQQKNEVLDQLLARFSEKLSTYAFSLYKLYGTATPEMTLYSKQQFISEYVSLSSERGLAFNYYHQYSPLMPDLSQIWNTANIAGIEKRIARLSGIKNYDRRNLAENPYFAVNETSPGVFKWKIFDSSGASMLWSSADKTSYQLASQEIYAVALALIETDENAVKAAFAAGIVPDSVIGNVQVKLSTSGNYYFNVVNPALPPSDPGFRIARQLLYFADPADLMASVLKAIRFMKYEFTGEGMFCVEHILMLPIDPDAQAEQFLEFCADDCGDGCCTVDPYSFRVSIVLPGFTPRFADMAFREFMEKLIREELPSHILAKICWVGTADGDILPDGKNQLKTFENLYLEWLKLKSDIDDVDPAPALIPFADYILKLNSIYPEGRLHDCENDDYSGDIILDRSKLGTSNNQ